LREEKGERILIAFKAEECCGVVIRGFVSLILFEPMLIQLDQLQYKQTTEGAGVQRDRLPASRYVFASISRNDYVQITHQQQKLSLPLGY